ncbi:unnamed protein product [Rotaria socialis]|uniref:Transmembrane protein n=1 Tax=Rotaria socialis TaxID=392032 RepID=A0A821FIL2_9BILA|nr:unnamed protein product [Rotaria socialis]CAF4653958.1 unnamed protein product [Rotaria socialis]
MLNIFESTLNTTLFNASRTSDGIMKVLTSWYLFEFIRISAHILLAFALFPQIIHLFKYRTRYIAGISYIWVIIRILALILLAVGNTLGWASIFQFVTFLLSMIIFFQIIAFSNNLHRENKKILIVTSLFFWIIGLILIFFFGKQHCLMKNIGYILMAIQMLPQILLNSLLQTTKAISKFSLVLLAMSDCFLFLTMKINHCQIIQYISLYYSFSFVLFICIQSTIYTDENIHLISRSSHTVLTPGIDMFTGLDISRVDSIGQDPQMFAIDDLELVDGSSIIYQPITTNKSSTQKKKQTRQKCVWYAQLGFIILMEVAVTVILIDYVWSSWIIFIPISIPVIFVFLLLRTKLRLFPTKNFKTIL